MDIDSDGKVTMKDLNLLLKDWNKKENNANILLEIINNFGLSLTNNFILKLKLTNESQYLYDNNKTSNIPSLNWINTVNNSNFNNLSLTIPNQKKIIKLNLDELSEYEINWEIKNGEGNFNLVINLYNNNYFEKINLLSQNSVTINTKNIFTSESLIKHKNAINSTADFKKRKFLLNKKDKHFLYNYFNTLDRKVIKDMDEKNKQTLERNVKMVNDILYSYFEENMLNVSKKTINGFSIITGLAKSKYVKTKNLSEIRKQPNLKYVNVDKKRQFNFSNLPKKIHKIRGKIRDIEVESNLKQRLSKKQIKKRKKIQQNIKKHMRQNKLDVKKFNHIQTLTTTTETSPMDPCTASNGEYIVTVRNATDLYIYDMNFNLLEQISTQDVFPTSSGAGDPIIMYDTFLNKWILIEFGISNGISLCRSTTSNPSDSWQSWLIQTPEFPDYPKIAIYEKYYAISTNESSGPKSYIIEKQDLIPSDTTSKINILNMKSGTTNNNDSITFDTTEYENPFIDMEPDGDYQPTWGVASVRLNPNTQYVSS